MINNAAGNAKLQGERVGARPVGADQAPNRRLDDCEGVGILATSRVEHYSRPSIHGTQYCPTCGLPSERDDARLNRMGVGQATFICAGSHLWSIHWVVAV